MNRIWLIVFIFNITITGFYAESGKPGVVILPFEALAGVSKPDTAAITEIVRTYVVLSNEFTVYENQAVEQILSELRLSAATNDRDIVNALRNKIAASLIIRGTVSKSNGNIIISIRLIDAETYYIVFNKIFYSTESAIIRDIRLFSESIANEAVALTVGITLENLEKLLKLEMLDEAYRKLQYYKQKYPQKTLLLIDYENRLKLALAKRAMANCRKYTELTKKNTQSAFALMEEAYYQGVSALFWLPQDQEALRKDYVQFVAGTVMKYFFNYAQNEKQLVVKKAKTYLNANPQRSLEIITDFLEKVGESEINADINAVILQARMRIADNLYREAKQAITYKDFDLAEKLINQALRVSNDYSRYIKEYKDLENAQIAYETKQSYDNYKNSPLWDPGAVLPYSIEVKTAFAFCDRVSYDIPFGGMLQLVEADFQIKNKINDALVFNQSFLVNYGSQNWSGMVIDANASLSYALFGAAWLPGLSGFYKDWIISAGVGPALYFMTAHGTLAAYGTEKTIDMPLGLLPAVSGRLTVEYAFNRSLSLGVELGKTWGLLLGSVYMGMTAFALFASYSW